MSPVKSIKSPAIVTILRSLFIVLVALLPGLFVSGQVKFTTIASNREIARGEYFQIEFVVENAKQIDQLNAPDFPGFQVAQGPIQSSGMSIVNGNMSQYKAISFVLQPEKTGKFIIQGATAIVDGKKMQSKPVTITVTASTTGPGNKPPKNPDPFRQANPFPPLNMPDPFAGQAPEGYVDRDYILRPGENVRDKIRKNLFVKVQVDKTTCFVGEPIVATYKLYSRLSSESRVTKRPSLNGFSVYDMVDPAADVTSVEKVNGKPFTVHIIRKTQLIPLQPGSIDLDPVEVENTVHFIRKNDRQKEGSSGNPLKDLFDQMSDDNMAGPEVEENVTLDTKPVTITVKSLPEDPKPANFNGAVGNFSMQAELTGTNLAAQDEATLKVTVKGKGNLPVINAPQVEWPSGVEAFEPSAKEDINKTTVPMSGSKTFNYVFTPRSAGHYIIPAISFSYFDPATQTYKKTGTDPITFEVAQGLKKKAVQSAPPALASSPVPRAVSIKTFVQQHLEWIFAVLILSGLAVFLWRQNTRLKKAEASETKKKKPTGSTEDKEKTGRADGGKNESPWQTTTAEGPDRQRQIPDLPAYSSLGVIVTDPLQDAKKFLGEGDYKGFYREINRAIWKTLASKLDLPASELNKYNMSRKLETAGWDMDSVRSLETILNECEMNLYTPSYDAYNMQQLLRQTESLLSRLA